LQLNNGLSNIWASPWSDNWQHMHNNIILPVANPPLPSTVSDLWIQDSRHWNRNFCQPFFNHLWSSQSLQLRKIILSNRMLLDGSWP
jgi:hypothetical protein